MLIDLLKRSELTRGLANNEEDANKTAIEAFINGILAGTTGYEPAVAKNVVGTPVLTLNGIAFPATQVPSSDANTLDDYEEGTFTPTIDDGTVRSNTYSTQIGKYTKVGNTVTIKIALTLTAKDGAFVGLLTRVANLPFAEGSLSGTAMTIARISNITASANKAAITAATLVGGAFVYLYEFQSGGSFTYLPAEAISNTTTIYIAGTYFI